MDKSGFGVGEEQAIKVLIHLDQAKQQKVVVGKQEWVSSIEYINAVGEALPPLLIFKGKHINTRRISPDTPSDYYFATSKNGWTSNKLGLKWLTRGFEPLTREKAANRQRLLITDGHSSHIQADFIAYYIENQIDLLILPPHYSHIPQPLDMGGFSTFKRFHTGETDAISQLSSQRIPRVEWIDLFSRARTTAMSKENILSGFKDAGISPLNRRRILNNLLSAPTTTNVLPCTPPETATLDLSLLKLSPRGSRAT
jgi:DDE superfamily endonuclease